MPAEEVNVIRVSMVDKVHQEPAESFTVAKIWKIENDITIFEDVVNIQYPHMDVVVVTLNIENYNIHYLS